MLAVNSQFRLVGTCSSVASLEPRARLLTPDLVLLDWDPQSDASELTTALGSVASNVSTVILVDDPGPELIAAMLAIE